MNKLLLLGVRKCLLTWLGNYLSDRKQRVKMGKSMGAPPRTKLGPILFLVMIDDLAPPVVITGHSLMMARFLRMFQNLVPQTSSLT